MARWLQYQYIAHFFQKRKTTNIPKYLGKNFLTEKEGCATVLIPTVLQARTNILIYLIQFD